MDLFMKKDPTKEEYLLVQTMLMLGMKKVTPDKTKKLFDSDDTK